MKNLKLTALLAFITLCLACLFLTGCRSEKEVTKTSNTVQIDTIYRERVQVDTILKEKRVEITKPVYVEQEIDCGNNQRGSFETGNSFVKWQVVDGKVSFKTRIDSTQNTFYSEKITSLQKEIERLKTSLKEKETTVSEKKVYIAIWWHIPLMILEGVILVLLLYFNFRSKIKRFLPFMT